MGTGRLIFITGLSGAGKTSVGALLYNRLKENLPNLVLFDGDEIRQVFDNQDYSAEGRRKYAESARNLLKLLTSQNINIICCVVGMMDSVRDWNRANIPNYFEIYLKVPLDILIKRDQKNLYSRALKGELSNVVGIDIEAEEPKSPDMLIDNDGSERIEEIVDRIIDALGTLQ